MADNDDTIQNGDKPAPRRRAPRKSDGSKAAKKPAARRTSPNPPAQPAPASTAEDRNASVIDRAAGAVGGRRNAALIAGGLAAAGAAAAALLSLRSSSPRKAANDTGAHAHQTDGTDSSGQMEALIADENMVPESTPTA